MKEKKIIFTLEFENEWINEKYYPVPASKEIPDWYKNMPSTYGKGNDPKQIVMTQTIKRCMPVFDAINAGYIIKTHTDITVEGNGFEWSFDKKGETVSFHPPYQVEGYKSLSYGTGVPKFRNPWAIKTPKGYSTLFINPMHRESCGFSILEGIVDTDTYNNSVQFPFIKDENFEGTIPAGTPIVQVIPFKRDEFKMTFGKEEERKEALRIHDFIRSTWLNGYRNNFRVKKTYR